MTRMKKLLKTANSELDEIQKQINDLQATPEELKITGPLTLHASSS